MEELDPLSPSIAEILVPATGLLIAIIAFVASYRRNRYLFDRSIAKSVLIGLVSASFWPIWLVASVMTRRQTAASWDRFRSSHHAKTPAAV